MIDPHASPFTDWEADIAVSMAQIAAGDVFSPEPVLQRIRETVARLEAKHDGHNEADYRR
jgi:hypothetical protein